jgi:UDP-2,3-diacylglucosamine hydrolase
MLTINLQPNKKIFFASDFHFGTPTYKRTHEGNPKGVKGMPTRSSEREDKVIRWLESIRNEAQVIFLVGDIFDFWFEYKTAIPKGFVRFQGKIAELTDAGIEIIFFTGNHDMWMFDYFETELGVKIYRNPQDLQINYAPLLPKEGLGVVTNILIGHGDGLGAGDYTYKFLKKIFSNKFFQFIFKIVHPDIGIGIASLWSRKSRSQNDNKTSNNDKQFLGEDEWLWQYCKEIEVTKHYDFYVFGHRHLPLDLPVLETSRYINLGEWLNYATFAVFDGEKLSLEIFEKKD